jgi:hypothetical protein
MEHRVGVDHIVIITDAKKAIDIIQ